MKISRACYLSLAFVLLLAGCQQHIVHHEQPTLPENIVGLIEFRYGDISAEGFTVTATPLHWGGLDAQALGDPLPDISVTVVSRGSFDFEGQRYLSSAFSVNNNTGASLENVTFLGVNLNDFISDTAIRSARNFNDVPVSSDMVRMILPTHGMERNGLEIFVKADDADFVAYAEGDIPTTVTEFVLDNDGTTVFPWGFVARDASDLASRLIPTDAPGVVTIAFKLPINGDPEENIFAFSFIAVVTSDDQVVVSQSPEEDWEATLRRALEVRADTIVAIGPGDREVSCELLEEFALEGYDPSDKLVGLSNVRIAGTDAANPTVLLSETTGMPNFIVCTPLPPAASILPTESTCGAAAVGETCTVTVRLTDNSENWGGAEFDIANPNFSDIESVATGALTAGCLSAAGAVKVGIICISEFSGNGVIAVVTFTRTADGPSSFTTSNALLINMLGEETPVNGGTLAIP